MSIKLDYMGLTCPIPLIKTEKEIKNNGANEYVILVDNEIAVENFKKMAKQKGYGIDTKKISDKEFEVKLNVIKEALDNESCECQEIGASDENIVVAIGTNVMGHGDEKLGKILIKGFIFALTQLETLPKTVLFYNKGAYLTCKGSESLEDIKTLSENGVTIKTCGTCLDFYNIKEELQVGEVTNMYDIVETQASASKIIRP